MTIIIGVCGSGDLQGQNLKGIYQKAEIIGREIAKNKGVLICGGKEGVMEAACKGAKQAGGLTIGILPNDRSEKNDFVDIPIVSGIGEKRNGIIIQSADCIMFIGGKWGTFNEITLAILHQKPIVFLKESSGIVDDVISSDLIKRIPSKYVVEDDPVQAVKHAFMLAQTSHPKH